MGVVGQIRSHLWLVNGDGLRRVKSPAPTWNWGPIAVRNYVPRSAGGVLEGLGWVGCNAAGYVMNCWSSPSQWSSLHQNHQNSPFWNHLKCGKAIIKTYDMRQCFGDNIQANQHVILFRMNENNNPHPRWFYRSSFSHIQQKWSAEANAWASEIFFKKGQSLKDVLQGVV